MSQKQESKCYICGTGLEYTDPIEHDGEALCKRCGTVARNTGADVSDPWANDDFAFGITIYRLENSRNDVELSDGFVDIAEYLWDLWTEERHKVLDYNRTDRTYVNQKMASHLVYALQVIDPYTNFSWNKLDDGYQSSHDYSKVMEWVAEKVEGEYETVNEKGKQPELIDSAVVEKREELNKKRQQAREIQQEVNRLRDEMNDMKAGVMSRLYEKIQSEASE